MTVNKKFRMILFILVCLITACTTVYSAIFVFEEPGMDPNSAQMARQVINSFNDIIMKDMKISLVKKVRVFLCPNEKSYLAILRTEFKFTKSKAIEHSESSVGMSRDDLGVIAVKFDPDSSAEQRNSAYFVTAHELAHQLQADLGGNYTGRNLHWMREGTADLIGAIVAEHCGYQSLEKWQLDQLNTLRHAKKYAQANSLGYLNIDEWDKLSQTGLHPYAVSGLMVLYLMNITKNNFYEAMADYFGQAASFRDDRENFTEIFGITQEDFYLKFDEWIKNNVSSLTHLDVDNNNSQEKTDLLSGFNICQSLLEEQFNAKLINNQRLLVAPNKSQYLTTLSKEFGLTTPEAQRYAQESSWRFDSGTTIIESSILVDRQKRIFHISSIVMKKFLSEQTSPRWATAILWLRYGIADYIGALSLERSGAGTIKSYSNLWLQNFKKAQPGLSLANLRTSKSWDEATAKYGKETVTSYAALASQYLIETKGLSSFNKYLCSFKDLKNSEAFSKAFGLSLEEFTEQFDKYIQSQKI